MNLKPILFIKKIVEYNTVVMVDIKPNSKLNKNSFYVFWMFGLRENRFLLEILCWFLKVCLGIFKDFWEFQETSSLLCLIVPQNITPSENKNLANFPQPVISGCLL